MNLNEKLIYTAVGAGLTLTALLIFFIASAVLRFFPLYTGYFFSKQITCEKLSVMNGDPNSAGYGVTISTNEHGGSITIYSNNDDLLPGMILDTTPTYGQIWVNGKHGDYASVSINGTGTLHLHSKNGRTSIDSKSLSVFDENNNNTVKLP